MHESGSETASLTRQSFSFSQNGPLNIFLSKDGTNYFRPSSKQQDLTIVNTLFPLKMWMDEFKFVYIFAFLSGLCMCPNGWGPSGHIHTRDNANVTGQF